MIEIFPFRLASPAFASTCDGIRKKLSDMDWNSHFFHLNVDEMALTDTLTDTLLYIFSKNIPDKTVKCNDKEKA